ncbi:MAG: hypothetical protein JWQ94_4014 [Tardiphaga sp.]|jgi:hypothetical protein|nr:hypothetical protein [Tardiphaga sp.]
MTAWSDYLRQQAAIADQVASTMTSVDTRKEFADIAAGYRRDADIEDGSVGGSLPSIQLPQRKPPTSLTSSLQAMGM